jgi:glutathione synthase
MRMAVILDPLEKIKVYKDSTYAMMVEAARRGHAISVIMPDALMWKNGAITGRAAPLALTGEQPQWYTLGKADTIALASFDAVLMRKDPPFDIEYVTATWLLEEAVRQGARVFNDPRAIRDHSEKLSIMQFPQFCVPTLVSRLDGELHGFIDEQGDVILKPLDEMGGTGIFRVRRADPNRNVIVETLSERGARTVMAQRYIPEIADGDKRVLLIGGKPVPYCLARIPRPGETRGNLAAGGTGVARPLSARDLEIAAALGPSLAARGLLLVGLDVIGDYLTEVNVTSPTCFREITDQSGFDVPRMFIDALEDALAAGAPPQSS